MSQSLCRPFTTVSVPKLLRPSTTYYLQRCYCGHKLQRAPRGGRVARLRLWNCFFVPLPDSDVLEWRIDFEWLEYTAASVAFATRSLVEVMICTNEGVTASDASAVALEVHTSAVS